jgi:hypothetical protein
MTTGIDMLVKAEGIRHLPGRPRRTEFPKSLEGTLPSNRHSLARGTQAARYLMKTMEWLG